MLMPSLFYDDFDLFDDAFGGPWFDNRDFKNMEKKLYGRKAGNIMSTDIKETEDGYEMVVDLPGFKKEDVTVELENGYLTITAAKGLEKNESDSKEAKKEGKYIRKERYSGEMKRSFYVGEDLKQEDIRAKFQHGLLALDIPKKDSPKVAASKYIAIEG
jgi:HSP20 family molecular chaperone IbpA